MVNFRGEILQIAIFMSYNKSLLKDALENYILSILL